MEYDGIEYLHSREIHGRHTGYLDISSGGFRNVYDFLCPVLDFFEWGSNNAIVQLSQKMRDELQLWTEKNYKVVSASIRFIVSWRPKDAPKQEKEHAVLLIDLTLKSN